MVTTNIEQRVEKIVIGKNVDKINNNDHNTIVRVSTAIEIVIVELIIKRELTINNIKIKMIRVLQQTEVEKEVINVETIIIN